MEIEENFKSNYLDDSFYQQISEMKHHKNDKLIQNNINNQQQMLGGCNKMDDICVNNQQSMEENINIEYFNKIKSLKQELVKVREQEYNLLQQIREIEQYFETKKTHFTTAMNISSKNQKQQMKFVLDMIKSKNINEMSNEDNKVHRNQYTQEEKGQILQLLSYYTASELSSQINVDANLISRWKTKGIQAKKKTGRKIASKEMEEYLLDYVTKERALQHKLSFKRFQKVIINKAKDMKVELKGSRGYISGFCKRNQISLRRINSKKMKDISNEEIANFTRKFQELFKQGIYDEDLIINFDETSLSKDELGNYTMAFQSENHVRIKTTGEEKNLYTIGLAISYSGLKLNQHVIWPSKGVKDVFKISIPSNTKISYRSKGSYYDRFIFKTWCNTILIPFSKQIKSNKRGLLIIDNFSGHKYDQFKQDLEKIHFDLLYLPPNSTNILQPLDYSINFLYKQQFRDKRENWQTQYQDKKLSHGNFLRMLSESWSNIQQQNILNSWNMYRKQVEEPQELPKIQKEFPQIQNKQEQLVIYYEANDMKDDSQMEDENNVNINNNTDDDDDDGYNNNIEEDDLEDHFSYLDNEDSGTEDENNIDDDENNIDDQDVDDYFF